MALSFTKIFKKKENESSDEKLVQQTTAIEQPAMDDNETKAKKHGEPGVCCGSCS
jgi:CCGSCS motif protein